MESGIRSSTWKKYKDEASIVDTPRPSTGEGRHQSWRNSWATRAARRTKKAQKQKGEKQKEKDKGKQEKQPKRVN
jgi:hypothetical protein